ncbi:restriction endonuclease subunit S [Thermodesulfobacteriota bacterium]
MMAVYPIHKLEDLSESINYGYTASAIRENTGVKFLRITDIQNGSVNWDAVPFCKCNKKEEKKHLLLPGDIVFARTGATTGKSYLIKNNPGHTVFASYLIRVRPNDKVDPRYLAHFFDTPNYWGQVQENSRGATLPGVNATKLKKLNIPLPLLPEQKRIAAILDKADAIRRKRQQAIKLADDFLRATFLDMFGDPVKNPKGWDEDYLENLAAIKGGVTKGRKLDGKKTVFVPYMRVANVQDGHLVLDDVTDIEVLPSDVEKYRLVKGDLLLTEGGDPDKLGRGAVWAGEINPCIHQNHIFRVRANTDQILPFYLSTLIGGPRGKRYFLRAAKQTTGIATINMTQLKQFSCLIPPLSLQRDWESLVRKTAASQDKKISALLNQDALFNSLTQRAFRGEL